MKAHFLILGIFLSSLSYSQTELSPKEKLKELSHKISQIKSCDLSKIWPGYTWENKFDAFIFSSTKEKQTYVLDNKDLSSWEMIFDETPAFARASYSNSKHNNKNYVSYNLDGYKGIISLIFHENFHFFGQDHIPAVEGVESRGDVYPFTSTPRVYRGMVNYHLNEALKRRETAELSLAKAKYWNGLHKAEFPEDYKSTSYVDMIEGSAMYSEALSLIFAENNCEFSETEFLKLFHKTEETVYDFFTIKESDKDTQSYVGGMLAYMIDYLVFDNKFDLKNKNHAGVAPIEELLSAYVPLPNAPQDIVVNAVEEDFHIQNKEAKEAIDEFSHKKIDGWTLISKPQALDGDEGGSYVVYGFINTNESDLGYSLILKKYSAEHLSPTVNITLADIHLYRTSQNLCGADQVVFWVKDTSVVEGKLISKSDSVNLTASSFEYKENMICIK